MIFFKNFLKYKNFDLVEKKTLIFGPIFSVFNPVVQITKILVYVIKKTSNIKITPIYCDGVQKIECNVYGGKWGGGSNFKKNCKLCQKLSINFWESLDYKPIKLSKFINKKENEQIENFVEKKNINFLKIYKKKKINFSKLTRQLVCNNYLTNNIDEIENYNFLYKSHLKNLIKLELIYSNIAKKLKPKIWISNDSFYGMWKLIELICKEKKIPFYSYWPHNKFKFSINKYQSVQLQNFKNSWKYFNKLVIGSKNMIKINKWINGKRNLNWLLPLKKFQINNPKISKYKKTFILAANVTWDLVALDKHIVFKDEKEWLETTIDYFRKFPEYQLIIKTHPNENNKMYYGLAKKNVYEIFNKIKNVPANVHIIEDEKISIRNLVKNLNTICFIVHTSTVGLEHAAKGYSVITIGASKYRGFGFTYDPKNKKEYLKYIAKIKNDKFKKKLNKRKILLAKKFILFNFHVYYMTIDLNKKKSYYDGFQPEEFDLNKNPQIEYAINKTLLGKEIYSKKSWPPII